MRGEDRYLQKRGRVWQYVRRIPIDVRAHYGKEFLRASLGTQDKKVAFLRRDAMEQADDAYWDDLRLEGKATSVMQRRYEAAVKRARALGYRYVLGADLAASDDMGDILNRLKRIDREGGNSKPLSDALLGRIREPDITFPMAFNVVKNEVYADYLAAKDEEGRKDWTAGKLRTIELFVGLYGDLPLENIDRELAREFYLYWNGRVTAKEGAVTGGYANRQIGNLRALYGDYFKYIGIDRLNPFDGFTFIKKRKNKKRPFSIDEISRIFLSRGPLDGMNREARDIVLMMVETGARLSELATLRKRDFILDHEYPHILIEERDGRSVKTDNSNRILPLVGVALEVAKRRRGMDGFAHYRSRRKTLSSSINKYMRENELVQPDSGLSAYSLRHSFEDRMKEARIDVEMRKYLMGHAIDRQEYGEYASLKAKWQAVKQIELPFDLAVVGNSD